MISFKKYSLAATFWFCILFAKAQCLPATEKSFFENLQYTGILPSQLLSGRTVVFYDHKIEHKDLEVIQKSFASTGIDAIVYIETEKLLGGYDLTQRIYNSLTKREVSNLIFFKKEEQNYQCSITTFNKKETFVDPNQSSWRIAAESLSEVLTSLNREALTALKKQNLLISEHPEKDFPINIISGNRAEAFTTDLRIDRLAVRLADNPEQDSALVRVCKLYPFKIEFVTENSSDSDLRKKGFWYVLNCIYAREDEVKKILGYPVKKQESSSSFKDEYVYKFYFKKIQTDNLYLGKQWDAHFYWETALKTFISNLRAEFNIH